jgi:hypothetical protein
MGLLVAHSEVYVAVLSLCLEMGSLRGFELLNMLPQEGLALVRTDRSALLSLPLLALELRRV